LAQESKESKESKIAPPVFLEGYIPVQIRPFSVPLAFPGGGLGLGTVTMFVIVRGQKNVTTFCRYMPRVREALALTVDRSPVPIAQNKFQLKDISKRLHQAINRVLPSPLIVKLHLLPTGWPIGKGAVDLELPGTDSFCMAIQELPTEVLAMLEAENNNSPGYAATAPRLDQSRRSVPSTPRPASRPVRPSYMPPSVMVKARKTDIPADEPLDPANCRNLNEIWSAGYHQVSGRQYWLAQAFTLDDNNDGIVDNVGFVLRSEDRPDLYIYYFPGQGRQSVITVPSLRIASDRDARVACAGQEDFTKRDADAAASGKTAAVESSRGVMAAAVGVLLIVFAGIYFVVSRRKKERRDQEADVEDDRREAGDRRQPSDRRHADKEEAPQEESETPDKGEESDTPDKGK
jgi:hypothetical protein